MPTTVQGSARQGDGIVSGVVSFPRPRISTCISGTAHGLWSQNAWIYVLEQII